MDYRVIKENDLFLLTDKSGDISASDTYGLGLYTKDTRFLSKFQLWINEKKPVLLTSNAEDNYVSTILLTNPHIEMDGDIQLWRESIEIERKRFIYDEVLYETIKVKNYYPKQVSFDISVEMDADFADMFIVRGFQHGEIGTKEETIVNEQEMIFHYRGADQVNRQTVVKWSRNPKRFEKGTVTFNFTLGHEQEDEVTLMICPNVGELQTREFVDKDEALSKIEQSYQEWQEQTTKVTSDVERMQRLVERGLKDIRVLLTDLGHGKFPVAGLPWFGVPFGRDSLIAALQMLPFNPEVAKGTLKTMAAYQGTKEDPWRDEQPGKIMHEIRFGELANTNQVPFTPYYGTIDATPLFLILLTEYVKWTGDIYLFDELQDNVENALRWIHQYGDRDGDLFVEYHQESRKGIANQGWKDSGDSIVHRNGDYAKTPIALCEVQGYVYQAKMGIAEIYKAKGLMEKAEHLQKEAEELKAKYNEAFWMEEAKFYAIALDHEKKQVGTITSNPGHTLYSGIIPNDRVEQVVNVLCSEKMFSGFGIRTMGKGEAGYNPMSYHDGSIWPHDNSLILLGLTKTGQQQAAKKVISGLLEAAKHFEYDRLPELFCGYDASVGKPIPYPVACSPQAWAAGTPFIFIQSLLGLFPNALAGEIIINPMLLDGMNELKVENISIGNGKLSLHLKRNKDGIQLNILRNTTGFSIRQLGE
jgi:glycogen debranching enzyme